ncbi:zinc finger protein 678-like [Ptychodera flava]|uniref:zinc finger protein 678-like n=1 Tax=Ptychodera flava TaxID=63121 RepID=UPI00396A7D9F
MRIHMHGKRRTSASKGGTQSSDSNVGGQVSRSEKQLFADVEEDLYVPNASGSLISNKRSEGDSHNVASGEGEWQCCECKQGFESKDLLCEHQEKDHQGMKPYPCEKCGHAFASKPVLVRHQRHRCSRPFNKSEVVTCEICDKKFANAGNVQRHKLAMHEIESRKPDPCELCGTECLNLRDLHLHKLESHQGEGLSALEKDQLEKCKCSICGKILANFSNMKRHHELHHKIGFQSKLKQYQRSQHTNRSQRKPTENNKWICRECEQSFESQILLRKHYKTHDNKCYRCEKCGKSFG